MEFIRRNTPRQILRNGYLTSNGNSYISTSSSYSVGSGGIQGNYLPSTLFNGRYRVDVNVDFYSSSDTPLWQFFKEQTTYDDATSATTTTTTSILKIEEGKLTIGEYEVLTTKHFYFDDNGNLHTPYTLVSDKDIVSYTNNYTSNDDGGGNNDNTTTLDHTHSNLDVLNELTNTDITNWNIAYRNQHTHSNIDILSSITNTDITNWNIASNNQHTHSLTTNVDAYFLMLNNFGGIRKSGTSTNILQISNDDITINALNKGKLYIGNQSENTSIVYIPTHAEISGETKTMWNSFTADRFGIQMPLTISLQSWNDTKAPITVNTNTLCPNLNAQYINGYSYSDLVNYIGVDGDYLAYKKGDTTTNIKLNYATKAQKLVDSNNVTYLSTWQNTVQLLGLGNHIYLGSQTYKNYNYGIYFITNDGNETTEGNVYWNYINGNYFYTQVPHSIRLLDTTVAPITTNSTVMCTNLNANYLGGYVANDFIKTTGNQTLKGNLTIDGNLVVNGSIVASDDISAYASEANTSLTTKIQTALANVENVSTIEEMKNILITLRDSI